MTYNRRETDVNILSNMFNQIRQSWVILVFLMTSLISVITWVNGTNSDLDIIVEKLKEHDSKLIQQQVQIDKNEELINKAILDNSNSLGKIYERLGNIEGILSRLIR